MVSVNEHLEKIVEEIKQLPCYGNEVTDIETYITKFKNSYIGIKLYYNPYYRSDTIKNCSSELLYNYKFELVGISRYFIEYRADVLDILDAIRIKGLKTLLDK